MQNDFLTRPLEMPDSLAEWYHEQSKSFLPHVGGDAIALANRLAEAIDVQAKAKFIAGHNKKYPAAEKISLLRPQLPEATAAPAIFLGGGQSGLTETSEAPAEPLPLAALAAVLGFGYGEAQPCGPNANMPRHLTSPTGLFPLEIYLLAARVENLDAGSLLHYQPHEHTLETLGQCPLDSTLSQIWATPLHQAALFIFIIGCWPRLRWRYGERSYRYLLLEAGQVAQNIGQAAAVWQRPWSAEYDFCDDAIHDLFLLDGVAECALHTLALG